MSATNKRPTSKKKATATNESSQKKHVALTKPRSLPAPLMGLFAALLVVVVMNHQFLYTQIMLWLTPADNVSTSIVLSNETNVSREPKIIIPKLNVDAPVVYGMNQTDEPSVQKSLENGVLHFAGTPAPGKRGNAVFVGHSSNDVWAPGDYKFVFAVLDRLEVGDEYALHYEGVRYTYKVTTKTVVMPSDTSVMQSTDQFVSTLITCTPTGTNLRRLVIRGEQISPTPIIGNQSSPTNPNIVELPGN